MDSMTSTDLQQLKSIVGDMRFIQAAALVASKLNENKDASAYMRNLARLDRLLGDEIAKVINNEKATC